MQFGRDVLQILYEMQTGFTKDDVQVFRFKASVCLV